MSLFTRVGSKLKGIYSQDDPSLDDPHQWRFPGPSSYTIPKPPRHNTGGSTSSSNSSSDGGGAASKHPPTAIPDPRILKNSFIPTDPALVAVEESGRWPDGAADRPSIHRRLVYPDSSHAAVHLALLECFRNLRRSATDLDVDVSDPSLAELPPAYSERARQEEIKTRVRSSAEQDEGASLPESVRWNVLVQLAVTRFTNWWMSIDKVLQHAAAYTPAGGAGANVQLSKDYLPPLDVLLVWYAFMLHDSGPGSEVVEGSGSNYAGQGGTAYLWACRSHGMMAPPDEQDFHSNIPLRDMNNQKLLNLSFPWHSIKDAIDLDTMEFQMTPAAKNFFNTVSGQEADIMQYVSGPPAYVERHEFIFFERGGGEQLNLLQAVKNQENFLDRAHALLWIRSPALEGSLERACRSYQNWQVARHREDGSSRDKKDEKGLGLGQPVITELPFGTELIWRTHRLYPTQYDFFCEKLGAEADKWADDMLLSPREGSSGVPPDSVAMCSCWICERVRNDAPNFAFYSRNRHYYHIGDSATDLEDENRADGGPMKSPPVHTSVVPVPSTAASGAYSSSDSDSDTDHETPPLSPTPLSALLSSEEIRSIRDDVGFHQAVEQARQKWIKDAGNSAVSQPPLHLALPTRPQPSPTSSSSDKKKRGKGKGRLRLNSGRKSKGGEEGGGGGGSGSWGGIAALRSPGLGAARE